MHSGGASSVFHRPQVPHRPLHSGAAAPQGPQRQGRVRPEIGSERVGEGVGRRRDVSLAMHAGPAYSRGEGVRRRRNAVEHLVGLFRAPFAHNSLARCRAIVASPGWRSLSLSNRRTVRSCSPLASSSAAIRSSSTAERRCRSPRSQMRLAAAVRPSCTRRSPALTHAGTNSGASLGQRPQRPGRAVRVGLAHGGLIAETAQHIAVARQRVGAGGSQPQLRLEPGGVVPASVGGVQITQPRRQPRTGRRRTPCPLERVDRGRAVAERLVGARLQLEDAG